MSPSDSNAQEEAVEVFNADGAGEVVILCEHASHHIPERYQGLGLAETDRTSHAAWDPGARAVSLALAKALDAPMVASRISRLVYDCNRPPEAPSAMPEQSEVIAIPGNVGLSPDAREERVQSVYTPFCTAVSQLLAARKAAGRDTLLITMHSFTPVYFGAPRAVEIGILHDSDSRLADAMLAEAQRLPHRRIARNDPYGPEDGVTHSLQLHGIKHGLANVMIEVRNDLLRNAEDEARMAEELLTLLRPALAALQTERQADA
ncbi:N-formylglutamate amidohydrolase [Phaeobacter sp. PT47_59]|uniref:N-formylglutamate amidohydrolase n=1 Tax=Phaeobacter sp. PT47_59 TaxID=3029979 RepID=UPI0023803E30|nr:N-formylglutamate amidohydrolase [Phaeobacter sp. PT47_59]MDE4176532.1 N-formylglutamate amidohydrolase [Phaeobacter sp. PT47_59]